MSKTVKQIAEDAKVSKQTVQAYIRKLGIVPESEASQTRFYSDADAAKITAKITAKDTDNYRHVSGKLPPSTDKTDEYIQLLNDQITAKDKEIEELKADRQAKDQTIKDLSVKNLELSASLVSLTTNQQELLARQQQLIAEVNNIKSQSSAADGTVIDGDHVRVPTETAPDPEQPKPKRSFFQWLDSKFSKKK